MFSQIYVILSTATSGNKLQFKDFKQAAFFLELGNVAETNGLMSDLLDTVGAKLNLKEFTDYLKDNIFGYMDSGICLFVPTADLEVFDTVKKGYHLLVNLMTVRCIS